MRAWVVLAMLVVSASGCEGPLVVDCSPGRFARVGDDGWCILDGRSSIRCPSLLPVDHDLPWGDRGCAAREFDPLPEGLCEAAGECASPDAGSGG